MRNLLIITFLSTLPALLSAKEIKVDYKDLSYTVKQDSKKFTYQDKSLKKEYKIKACNKDQFEFFWARYEINKKDITSFNKVHGKAALKLKDNKKKIEEINPNAKLGRFLISVPNKLVSFEINESTKCKK